MTNLVIYFFVCFLTFLRLEMSDGGFCFAKMHVNKEICSLKDFIGKAPNITHCCAKTNGSAFIDVPVFNGHGGQVTVCRSCSQVRRSCPHPGTLTKALVFTSAVASSALELGRIISYRCLDGFVLEGSESIMCTATGTWSDIPPVCTKACNDPGTPSGALLLASEPFVEGVTARYICNDGSQPIGEDRIMCTASGTWSSAPPVCSSDFLHSWVFYSLCGFFLPFLFLVVVTLTVPRWKMKRKSKECRCPTSICCAFLCSSDVESPSFHRCSSRKCPSVTSLAFNVEQTGVDQQGYQILPWNKVEDSVFHVYCEATEILPPAINSSPRNEKPHVYDRLFCKEYEKQ